nr:MAG TPA: hypothetical protein [Caudoviricetes sp.]
MSYLDKTGLQHLIEKIKNRVIPIDKGGTGATTASDAVNNLFVLPLPITKGGTASTHPGGALANLMRDAEIILDNKSIAAGGVKEFTVKGPALAPYTVVGVLDWYVSNASSNGGGASQINVYGVYVKDNSSGDMVFKCRNIGSSTARIKLTATIKVNQL